MVDFATHESWTPSLMKHILVMILLAVLAYFSIPAFAKSIECNAPKGIPESRLLFFGEVHGSVEAPALVGKIACAAGQKGPTALLVELPANEQAAIDRYLASSGDAISRAKLLSGKFWQSDKDGRSSAAMAALIEQVRSLRQHGLPLSIFAFAQIERGTTPDASYATAIRAFHANHPTVRIIALLGNVHASQAPFKVGEKSILTTGYLLRDLNPTSVFLAYHSGSIWACMPDCGVHQVTSTSSNARKADFYKGSPFSGYSSSYVLPSITASPPAVDTSR